MPFVLSTPEADETITASNVIQYKFSRNSGVGSSVIDKSHETAAGQGSKSRAVILHDSLYSGVGDGLGPIMLVH